MPAGLKELFAICFWGVRCADDTGGVASSLIVMNGRAESFLTPDGAAGTAGRSKTWMKEP